MIDVSELKTEQVKEMEKLFPEKLRRQTKLMPLLREEETKLLEQFNDKEPEAHELVKVLNEVDEFLDLSAFLNRAILIKGALLKAEIITTNSSTKRNELTNLLISHVNLSAEEVTQPMLHHIVKQRPVEQELLNLFQKHNLWEYEKKLEKLISEAKQAERIAIDVYDFVAKSCMTSLGADKAESQIDKELEARTSAFRDAMMKHSNAEETLLASLIEQHHIDPCLIDNTLKDTAEFIGKAYTEFDYSRDQIVDFLSTSPRPPSKDSISPSRLEELSQRIFFLTMNRVHHFASPLIFHLIKHSEIENEISGLLKERGDTENAEKFENNALTLTKGIKTITELRDQLTKDIPFSFPVWEKLDDTEAGRESA